MRKMLIFAGVIVAVLMVLDCAAAGDFYAYYTRLDYEIPIDQARDYIPQEIDEDSKELLRMLEEFEGEEEEEAEEDAEEEEEEAEERGRRPRGPITGRYADVVVNVGDLGQLVFSRVSGYMPCWRTDQGDWYVQDIVPGHLDVGCLYSYARIIENEPDRVLVHWRYMPNVTKVGPADVVHEYFEMYPDGTVFRTVKEAAENLADHNDPDNRTVQTVKLKREGIEQIALRKARLSKPGGAALEGLRVRTGVVGSPAAWWKFDEALEVRPYGSRDLTIESVSGRSCAVDGNIALWKQGVSGTGLAFDGYGSKVALPASHAPSLRDELTVEAWVVLGAYPWNWAPLVHQSLMDPGPIEKGTYDERGRDFPRREGKGYYLGVNAYGHPIFVVDGNELKGSVKLSTYRWTHVAATYGDDTMRIFVDGQECGSMSAPDGIIVPDVDVLIGLNNVKGRPTDPVRGPMCHMADIYGIEGLIDEVKIYDTALDLAQVNASYNNFKPDRTTRDDPDLDRRILPGRPGVAEKFGAEYTELGYHELWDNLWRTSEYADVIVKFDTVPGSVAFWRGINGSPAWVTENNKWMADQSLEIGGPHGCSEHMADKQYRHSYVRIIENTDARVVVHWRYPSIDVGYLFPSPYDWTDEYYHIYPDGSGVRKVKYRHGIGGWHDVQFLSQPGTTPMDTLNLQAVTVANLDGKVHEMTWSGSNGVPRNGLRDACISMINFKSDYKVFLAYQKGCRIGTWGSAEQSPYTDDPFAGPWNHWPVSQMPSDGRYASASDRLTHAAVGGAGNVTRYGNMAIYGLTDQPISSLVPLARSWNNPAAVTRARGCTGQGYSKEQRAYEMTALGSKLSFTLDASEQSPVVNPCLVIRNWGSDNKARLRINRRTVPAGKDFRQGIVRDTDGTQMLVVWIKVEATRPVAVSVTRVDR